MSKLLENLYSLTQNNGIYIWQHSTKSKSYDKKTQRTHGLADLNVSPLSGHRGSKHGNVLLQPLLWGKRKLAME
jgi:hypothetical protein